MKTNLLSIAFCAALSTSARAGELNFEKPKFTVTIGDGWSTAEPDLVQRFSEFGSQGALAHLRQKNGVIPTAEVVDSAILLLYSKLKLGSPGDNPNLILAKEKAWSKDFEQTGAGYLQMMQERVKLVGAPTKFEGEPKEVTIGDAKFYQQDAVNTRVVNAATKQRYLCTFVDGYYVYFILSLNDEADADYAKMLEVVKSFRMK